MPPLVFKHRATPTTKSESSQTPGSQETGTDSVALFRRAKEFFPLVYEETKREKELRKQRQRKQQQQHDDEPKRREQSREISVDSDDDDDDDVKVEKSGTQKTSGPKRRKVSHDSAPGGSSRRDATPQHGETTSPEPSPRRRLDKGKGVAGFPPRQASEDRKIKVQEDDSVILLDDDDDDDDDDVKPAPSPVRRPLVVNDDDDDDEYERALARERERDAQKAAEDNKTSVNAVDNDLDEAADPEFEEYILRARARNAAARAAQAAQEAAETAGLRAGSAEAGGGRVGGSASLSPPPPGMGEPSYCIFLTAHFPEPVPPMVARLRMDQEMTLLKEAFLGHARRKGVVLPEDDAATVVLTWKGEKLYSWNTGHSLGIRPDQRGYFHEDSNGLSSTTLGLGMGLPGFQSGGLHLEIWTAPLYEAYLVEQERQRKRNLGEVVAEDLVSDNDGDDDGDNKGGRGDAGGHRNGEVGSSRRDSPSDQGNAGPQGVRLVLKSQDFPPVQTKARGNTTVAHLAGVFREQRAIPPDKTIHLYWDGERLDEDSTVGDAEMEDMDTVEVYVR